MEKYNISQLMGCVTDGLIFHYYKFVDEGNLIMKLVWAYQLLYDIYLFSFKFFVQHFDVTAFLFQRLNCALLLLMTSIILSE